MIKFAAFLFCAMPLFSQSPVVVELFTSEGCSSCPPADKTLEQLSHNPNVIVLSEHVDYWNRLGWRDPYSAASFSRRQGEYSTDDRVYTPEFVVDGQEAHDVHASVRKAAEHPKAKIELSKSGGSLIINVAEIPGKASVDVMFAITESGLRSSVTRGENSGRTLEHTGVVRDLKVLGQTQDGAFSARAALPGGPNKKAVVFLQDRQTHRIIGAAAVDL